MTDVNFAAQIRRQYDGAHALHYAQNDLRGAIQAYERIISTSPQSAEADYSRSQIRNIANFVVPPADLLLAQITLVLRHLGSGPLRTASDAP